MKIYIHKLTAFKIIAFFFLTVIEMPGYVLIKKPGTFYHNRGCKKGLSRLLNFRKRNVEFTPVKTLAQRGRLKTRPFLRFVRSFRRSPCGQIQDTGSLQRVLATRST